ncbi:MAG: hypothetical protein KC420_08500 [Myxococcales bacterium]|nr:hypothetical protein [Myxococcales bacterium]MCB9705518.1 hypothetical protein [Myxococcales bacterium]
MPEKKETVILTGNAAKLTPEAIAELKAKYGIDVKIRSSAAAVGKLISAIDLASSYDRTHPGYDRSYDRDPDVSHSIGAVINPAINPLIRGGGSSGNVGGGG